MTRPSGPPWSPGDAAAVNEFLNTELGRRWLAVLQWRKPKMEFSSTEKAAITGSFAAGYESFFHQISATRVAMQAEENMSAKAIDPAKD